MFPRGRVLALSWTLAALCLAVSPHGLPGDAAPGLAASPAVAGQKVAIFGVDAADWRVIDRLVAAGQLPTFARLKRIGALGVLQAEPPLLSPLIWTTIATGRRPEDHGVLDFMVDRPGGGQMPVSGGTRRVKALWEIWSERGRKVVVSGWWATWPADHVSGLLASDRLATPHILETARPDAGLVYPPSALGDVLGLLVEPTSIDYAALNRLVPLTRQEFERAEAAARGPAGRLYGDRFAHFRAAVAAARSYSRIAAHYGRSVRPDFWACYLEVVDTASHLFVGDRTRGEKAIAAAYREVDDALTEAAGALDPDTLLLVVSDHGFQPPDAGVREDPADLTAGATAWHRPYGIIAAVKAGALASSAERSDAGQASRLSLDGNTPAPAPALGTVSPLDIAPTLLDRAGLPVAADMPGRVIPALATRGSPPRVPSYGAHALPDAPAPDRTAAAAEIERLRALGYVSGAAAVTSLARVNLGEILFRRGDLRGAVRELEAVLRGEPLNTHAALWLARAYAGLGRAGDAIALYDRLVQAAATTSFTLDPVVVLAATDLDLAAGRVDAASARLQRVPAAVRAAPETRLALGAVAEAGGRPAEAESGYREILARAPSDFDALQRLMDLLLRQRRAEEAVAVTASAARAFPSSPQHLSLAGEAALAARHYPQAERAFSRALELAPDADALRVDLARAQLLGGRPDAALGSLPALGRSRDADMVRGASMSARRDWEGAIVAYRSALGAGAPTPDLLNALAAALLQAGRPGEAERLLDQSLTLQPNQPAARALLQQARKK